MIFTHALVISDFTNEVLYIFSITFLVQVIGSLQSVQDALFRITSRIRETIFPLKPSMSNVNGMSYMSSFPEIPPPLFRPRHDPASPGRYSPVRLPHGMDRSAVPSHPLEHQSSFSHGMDRLGPSNLDRAPYPYGGERPGHGPPFDRSSSPRMWTPQVDTLLFLCEYFLFAFDNKNKENTKQYKGKNLT